MEGNVQCLALCIDGNRTAVRADSCKISILAFGNVDSCINTEVVDTFFFFNTQLHIRFIKCTGNFIGDVGRIQRSIIIETLTCIIKADIAGFQGCGGSSQAISNLYNTGEVLFAFGKIAVGKLACQCIQHLGYAVGIFHSNTGIVGNQAYCRACSCSLDNSVACFVVGSCFAVAFMCIENIGVAAVFINSQVLAVLLEDVACMCCISAAGKAGYMAACKAARNLFAVLLVGPGCTICQPQVEATVACLVITGGSNLVQAASAPGAVCTLQCQINSRRGRSCFILPIIIGFCRLS